MFTRRVVRRTELTCTILLHVVMLSRVSELTELVLMLFLILSWGRGLDERSKLSLKILVIPNRNLTHTMLQPEKLGVIQSRCPDMAGSCSPATVSAEKQRSWQWHSHRSSTAPSMCSRRWNTRLSSPTTQHSPGRELISARCEKPIPLQRARHPDTAAASLTSARRSNGLLARLTPAAAADAGSPWGVVGVSTAAMTSSVSVDERALILAVAP